MSEKAGRRPNEAELRIDDETLAAFLDGGLEGEERQRVLEAIADDPEIARLVAEAAAFVAAERAENASAASPRPSRTRSLGSRSLAVAAVAAAVLVLLVTVPLGSPVPDAAALADRMALGPGADLGGLLRRSDALGFGSGIESERRAVLLGALIVDLEIARRLEDGAGLRVAASQLLELSADLDLEERRRALLAEAERGRPPDDAALGGLEGALRRRVPRRAFDAGRVLEAARLASALGDTAFAERWTVRRQLRRAEGYSLDGAGPVGWSPGPRPLPSGSDDSSGAPP